MMANNSVSVLRYICLFNFLVNMLLIYNNSNKFESNINQSYKFQGLRQSYQDFDS